MASRVFAWLDSRLKLKSLEKTLLDEPIPGGASWIYVFGSATLFLFVLQAITGMFLAVYYAPTPDHAYDSVQFIENQVSFGWFVRGLHHWGASGMVIVVGLHMLQVFLYGAFKPPREMMWMVGVVLFLLVMAFAFTGYLLPWDQLAIWAVTVGTNMARATPFLGHEGPGAQLLRLGDVPLIHAADDARFALLGGTFVGEGALLRFYVLHCVGLPLGIAVLMAVHFWRVRKDGGISGPL